MKTKKEYVAPDLQVVVMAVGQMLASSVTIEQASGEYSGEFHSREYDFGFDDEE